ncbi:hypothetical protein BCR43DRAFT_492392 [Syncephalastrum racemosum]|uniref:MHYT domain-containing protein n=1 Tax=Syncephalastrum racemosum TaxID=13706 RepID=A0A1X2HDI7_SYNRA|nr:hypothetical protein BCR43DRAFT_492392 [Syncephalastrum racemosum]
MIIHYNASSFLSFSFPFSFILNLMDGPARQHFNAGFIVVSYLISVAGAMTTLELLMRRTHYKGLYNWFLLIAAALSMGGVGIWSMHFIGNNALSLAFDNDGNDNQYQLAYSAGYTFISLAVAVSCMFIAFAFVGITEEAHLVRIIASGVLAGGGIATMHYLGQFAIDFFILQYKTPYIAGAVVIACVALTAALCIFFKLREQWENQWYKRLGCSLLMALAVCGMHYTAMAGTVYYKPGDGMSPPTPAIQTGALIGIIVGIVVVACAVLLYVGIKSSYARMKRKRVWLARNSDHHRRLIIHSVMFDSGNKILVKTDGSLASSIVTEDFDRNCFSLNHSAFQRILEATNEVSNSTMEQDGFVEKYITAAKRLSEELKLSGSPSDLGVLSTIIIQSTTQPQKHTGSQRVTRKPTSVIRLLKQQQTAGDEEETVGTNSSGSEKSSRRFQILDDTHLFLVRKVHSTQYKDRLLAHGFRFAEPVFISRIIGNDLLVQPEQMMHYFDELQQLAESTIDASCKFTNQDLKNGVYVGLLGLMDDQSLIIDKHRPLSLPLVQLRTDDGEVWTAELGPEEKMCVFNLQSQSLLHVASMMNETTTVGTVDSTSEIIPSTSKPAAAGRLVSPIMGGRRHEHNMHQFMHALSAASRKLLDTSPFAKAVYGPIAKLHGEVIEVPAFTLTHGSCDLILFRAVATGVSASAINQNSIESFKCIPLRLWKSMASYATDQAVESYRSMCNRQKRKITGANTLTNQQRMYISTAIGNGSPTENNDPYTPTTPTIKSTTTTSSSSSSQAELPFPSLPPPPRLKKSKFAFSASPASIHSQESSSEINSPITPDSASSNATASSISQTISKKIGNKKKAKKAPAVELPVLLNLVPTQARFLWLDIMVDETYQLHIHHQTSHKHRLF